MALQIINSTQLFGSLSLAAENYGLNRIQIGSPNCGRCRSCLWPIKTRSDRKIKTETGPKLRIRLGTVVQKKTK